MKPSLVRIIFVTCFLWIAASGTAWSDILGVVPGIPNTTYNFPTGTSYDPASGLLKITATPLGTLFVDGGTRATIATPRSLTITIQVDSSGNLIGGVTGDDLVLIGTVGGYTGTLLTGEIIEYGIKDASATVDYLDFRFRVTGGSMAGLFAGQDIGVTQTIENSTFSGSFAVSFKGSSKGNLGPIPPKPVCDGVIGDFIWNDLNRNGIQDANEPGINNVTVNLLDSNGVVIVSKVSGPNGAYLFSGLCAGDYTVVVDTATIPAGLVPSPTLQGSDPARDSNPNSFAVNLPTGTSSDRTIDFGYNSPCSGIIGDLVWHDKNRNGIQDPGEPGIGSVKVNLLDKISNALITTTTTNGSGIYQFNGLCAGDYRVEVIAPSGFVLSPELKGGDPAFDSNPNPSDVTLASDSAIDQTIDFGFNTPCTGSIGDLVWNDLNRNGIFDSGEPGINGVSVLLKDGFSNLIATATTTGNGSYLFGGLCAGTYRVEVDAATIPAGMVASPVQVGPDRTVDSNISPSPVILTSDSSNDLSIDFGFNSPCAGTIGDMVWFDTNRDGIQNNGELGINGVPVTLKDVANTTIATTTTGLGPLGQAGFYTFAGLCAGSYTVEVATPAGLVPSPSLQGTDAAVDSNGSPASVYLPNDYSNDPTIDFGFNAPCAGSLGNLVWDDQNRNGIQDAGEPGLDGVTVNLRTPSNTLLASTTTSGGGLYQFNGLCTGDYLVEVIPPSGRTASPTLQGTNRELDSNPNPYAVNLPTDSSSDQSIDFGFNTPCSGTIGDFVWHDSNRNGIQDAGELGISGAAVTLKNSVGTVIASTNTTSTGSYLFGGLCSGDYTVEVVSPAGFVASPSFQGTNPEVDGNGSPAQVNLPLDNSSDLSIDFGFNTPCTAIIGDFVWNDLNYNGVQDLNESGIGGISVLLRDDQNTLLRTTNTLANGFYQFIGLCAGTYRVEVIPPVDMIVTIPGAGGNPELDSNTNPSITVITSDTQIDNSVDFGLFKPAPAIAVTETCDNAPSPDQAMVFTATISNNGNETLTGISCSDTLGKTVAVADLIPGASASASFSYIQLISPLSDAVTCVAKGAISSTPVTATSAAKSCSITTAPLIAVVETCDNAPAPDQAMVFTATISNNGNETLTGISCRDTLGKTVAVADLVPSASASASFSYIQLTSPLSDAVTCSAKGVISSTPVTATSAAKSCNITTAPAITVTETCTNAADPTKPIVFTAMVKNTGNETLTGVSCKDTLGTTMAVADILPNATGSVTFSYIQSTSPLSDTVTCSAKGVISSTPVTVTSAAKSCNITTAPAITVTETCTNAADPTKPIVFTAMVKNTGNETLTGISCKDTLGTTLAVANILPNATGSVTFSYIQSTSPLSDTVTCSAKGAISNTAVSAASAPASCTITPPVCTGVIGDFIWNDLNQNGIQDAAEPGIAGVAVTLTGTNIYGASVSQTVVSQSNGSYLFTGLCQGTYTITTSTPSGFSQTLTGKGTPATDSNGKPSTVSLASNSASELTIDFGFYKPCIPCTNGVINMTLQLNFRTVTGDRNERIRVHADSMTGQILYDSWNDSNTSDPGLPVGAMFSFAVPPAATQIVVTVQGANHPSETLKATFSAQCDLAIGVVNGNSYITFKVLDAVFDGEKSCSAPVCTGSIGNVVWNDMNFNGIQDATEVGLTGVALTLTGTDSYGKAINMTTTTSANGLYLFSGLCQGTYSVSAVAPTGFSPTLTGKGTIATDSNGIPAKVVLATNAASDQTIDFGFYKPCTACVNGVTNMTLQINWRTANTVNERVRVRADGMTGQILYDSVSNLPVATNFSFAVPASVKKVYVTLQGRDHPSETLKATFSAECDLALGTVYGVYPNYITFKAVTATFDGDRTCNVQQPPVCTGMIGDWIWKDANANGIQDPTEKGISGVTLTLKNTTTGVTTTTKTDCNGNYLFTGLCAGTYTVTSATPSGCLSLTKCNVGTDTTKNSSPNPATVTLSSNASDMSIDFGFK